jgi:hypothetical protein
MTLFSDNNHFLGIIIIIIRYKQKNIAKIKQDEINIIFSRTEAISAFCFVIVLLRFFEIYKSDLSTITPYWNELIMLFKFDELFEADSPTMSLRLSEFLVLFRLLTIVEMNNSGLSVISS